MFSFQGLSANIDEEDLEQRLNQSAFRKRRQDGYWHLQFDDFNASLQGYKIVGVHRIFRQ